MTRNVGGIDRVLRIVVGLVLLSLIFVGPQTLWGLVGLVPLGTALIGYCPDVPGFLPWMTARDVLESSAMLFRLPEPLARQRVGDLLDLTGLADTRTRVGGYSRGMRQRLGLAQALGLGHRLRRNIAHGDAAALGHQLPRKLPPHAGAAAGDDGDPSCEILHVHLLLG